MQGREQTDKLLKSLSLGLDLVNLVDGSVGICPVETNTQGFFFFFYSPPCPWRKADREADPLMACSHITANSPTGVNITVGEKKKRKKKKWRWSISVEDHAQAANSAQGTQYD